MPGAHEHMEHAEEAEHIGSSNKKIALLISVLALFLAFAETLGKSAQTEGLRDNIEAANLWAFYQAKHMRETTLRTAAEIQRLDLSITTDPDAKAAKEKQINSWLKTADRYQSDPEKHEGRKELEERAREKEHERDRAFAEYHHYEIASAALQIGIVLASASVITSMLVLAWLGGGLGVIGVVLMAIGYFTPELLHGVHII